MPSLAEQWTERFAERLSWAISRQTPAGLGRWPRAWEIVEVASRAVLAELVEIEAGRGDRERAKRLGLEVLAAWKRAEREWRAEVEEAA